MAFRDVRKPHIPGVLYACPCCGYHTIAERGGDDICPVCFWQDDGQDDDDADDVRGGPNYTLSLSAARKNYREIGATEKRVLPFVRPPTEKESRSKTAFQESAYMSDFEMSVAAEVHFLPLAESGRKRQPFENWTTENGRRHPPSEQFDVYYLPNARFEEDPESDKYFVELIIEWTEVYADGLSAVIRFSLRRPEVACGRIARFLHPGSRFTLHDGRLPIARGEVISEPQFVTPRPYFGDVVRLKRHQRDE